MKQFCAKVDVIMISQVESYHQTQQENSFKIVYVYSIAIYIKYPCFHNKIKSRFKFYASN